MKLLIISCLVFASVVSEANVSALNLDQYKGKVVYVDFWASWCGPCKESFPWLNKMVDKYPEVVFLGVNLDKEKADAESFLTENPAKFKIIFNPAGSIAEQFEVKGMPYSVLINSSGQTKHPHIGFNKQKTSEYEAQLKSLLGEAK